MVCYRRTFLETFGINDSLDRREINHFRRLGVRNAPKIELTPYCPFGWDGHVAAFVMNSDRWDAGNALMKAQSPEGWNVLMAAGKLTADKLDGARGVPGGGREDEERTALHDSRAGAVSELVRGGPDART